jgi:hypothetical protein
MRHGAFFVPVTVLQCARAATCRGGNWIDKPCDADEVTMDISARIFLALSAALMLGAWIFALYRAATNKSLGPRERGIWVVFIGLFFVLGAIAYLSAMGVLRKYQIKVPEEH